MITTSIVVGKPLVLDYFSSKDTIYTEERYLPKILLDAHIISSYKEAIEANLGYSLDCIGVKIVRYKNKEVEIMVGL